MSNPLASPFTPEEPAALTEARIRALEAAAARDEAQADEARERARYQKAQADRSEVDKQINDIRLRKEQFSEEEARIRHDKAQKIEKLEIVGSNLHGRFRFNEPFLPKNDEKPIMTMFGPIPTPATIDRLVNQLEAYHTLEPTGDIDIVFDSPGGAASEGFKLFNILNEYRAVGHKVTCGTYGAAASMAGIVLQAGDVRWMGKYARFHMHEVRTVLMGTPKEIAEQQEWTAKVAANVLDIFAARTKLSKARLTKMWENKEVNLSAKEAKELGFVDEVR